MSNATISTSAKEWDRVRTAFASSIMVDTALSSLAQNLEGPDWPIKKPNETPAAYIDLSYDEAVELLALKGQPPESIDLLTGILRDTLAFDDPFGDMVAQAEVATEKDNPILKNLAKLEIPTDHPIELTGLSRATLDFCALEKLTTLGEFAVFAQGMAQAVVVGGDFRALLNALSHVDEKTLAHYLPYRPGTRGLHLIEAVALTVRAQAETLTRHGPVPPEVAEHVQRLVEHFSADAKTLRQRLGAGGTSLSHLVTVLNDSPTEALVTRLLAPHLERVSVSYGKSEAGRKGWWSRLIGR